LCWTFANAGVGYSGPAIVGERLYMLGGRDGLEQVLAIDTKNGKELWSAPIGLIFTFQGNIWGNGPRSTPTVDGDRVFALGAQGTLVCLESEKGHEIWRVNLLNDLDGEISPAGGGPKKIGWGFCESPLLDGDRLICTPGGRRGTLAALNKTSGKVLWRSSEITDPATYASVMSAQIAGISQYVFMTDRGVAAVAAADGKLLWRYQRKSAYPEFVIPTPISHDDLVYTTAGFGGGCDLVRIVRDGQLLKSAKIYSNKNMVNNQGGVVLVGNYVFGYSEGKGWLCQDFAKGSIVWSEKRKLGRGSLVAAGGNLYCFGEDEGDLVMIRAAAGGWHEAGRLHLPRQSTQHAPNGKIWTPPVIADGRLYLRDQEFLFCYDVQAH
jgi:outer membrane protein assembly factor BamB